MTNEEAIKALKRIRDEAINNFVGDWQDYEAFDIALKVLADRKDEPQTDNGIGCSRCEGRFDCYDRDMPHAVHCNNYGKITDEPQAERREQ